MLELLNSKSLSRAIYSSRLSLIQSTRRRSKIFWACSAPAPAAVGQVVLSFLPQYSSCFPTQELENSYQQLGRAWACSRRAPLRNEARLSRSVFILLPSFEIITELENQRREIQQMRESINIGWLRIIVSSLRDSLKIKVQRWIDVLAFCELS